MRNKRMYLGLLISAVFIFVLFRNIEFNDLATAFGEINYLLIVPAIIIQVTSYWFRSVRWGIMLKSIKRIETRKLFPIVCISYMANNTLPLRVGEIVRSYFLGEKEKINKLTVFSTILLERVYDGITLLFFLGVVSFIFPFPLWVKQIGAVTTLLFIFALLVFISLVKFKSNTVKLINKLLRSRSEKVQTKVLDIMHTFIEGLDVIKDKKLLLPIAFISIIIWLMEAYMLFSIAKAFQFENAAVIAIFSLVIINLGIMIPSSPGYVGTFEYFCVKSLSVFFIAKELALSFALVLRVAQYIPITVIGFLFFVKEGVPISQLYKINKKEK